MHYCLCRASEIVTGLTPGYPWWRRSWADCWRLGSIGCWFEATHSMKAAWILSLSSAFSLSATAQAGKDWGVERESYVDPVTEVRVWELTKGTNVSDNLYFH